MLPYQAVAPFSLGFERVMRPVERWGRFTLGKKGMLGDTMEWTDWQGEKAPISLGGLRPLLPGTKIKMLITVSMCNHHVPYPVC
jgi:hypothetical protein